MGDFSYYLTALDVPDVGWLADLMISNFEHLI